MTIRLTGNQGSITAHWTFWSDTLGPGIIPLAPLGSGTVDTTTIPSIDVTEPAAPATEPAAAGTYLDLSSQIDNAIGFNPNLYIQFTSVSNEKYCTAPVPLQVFGTGLSATGTYLSSGSVDPHYTLVTPVNGHTPPCRRLLPASATCRLPLPGYVYQPRLDGSRRDSLGENSVEPPGYYDYRTTFVLAAGLNPQSVVLTGDWAVDNSGHDLCRQ